MPRPGGGDACRACDLFNWARTDLPRGCRPVPSVRESWRIRRYPGV
jgi:hypothetical protein